MVVIVIDRREVIMFYVDGNKIWRNDNDIEGRSKGRARSLKTELFQ